MSAADSRCSACSRSFVGSGGLLKHWRQTNNPLCIALYQKKMEFIITDDDIAQPASPSASAGFEDEPMPQYDERTPYDCDTLDFGFVSDDNESDSESDSDLDSIPSWEPPLEWEDDDEPTQGDVNPDVEDPPVDAQPREPPAEARFLHKPYVTTFGGSAGAKLNMHNTAPSGYDAYNDALPEMEDDGWAPFSSQINWEIARWAKLRGSTSTALDDLLKISGVVEKLGLTFSNARELNEIIDKNLPNGRPVFVRHELLIAGVPQEFFARPLLPAVRALWGDPEFAQDLIFAPERHYSDANKTIRMYSDMHTGKWWWATQKELEKIEPGATIVPLIIATDKTQTTMFRNKSAYPMYITLGNIPKHIRRKPSRQAYVLIGYLPTTALEHIKVAAVRRRALRNLYHACLRKILEPLEEGGIHGINMLTGTGDGYRCHILAPISAIDYPEQCLATGCKAGECPCCPCPRDELGHGKVYPPRDLGDVKKALALADGDPREFTKACKDVGINPIYGPYWENLPFCNPFLSTTPDILHQLLQGVFKHVFNWVKEAYGPNELDARCRRLPPNHNIRLFMKGISTLSRISGAEHGQISRILLGLIVDLPLPGGHSPARLVRAVRAILDFLYLSQYPVHSSETLIKLQESLDRFHDNKSIFVDLGIRDHFNFPKIHIICHEPMFIKLYGTLDNYNTEYTERLHIDFAKDAYRASNRKDEYFQMTVWLERKEKILRHEKFIRWRRSIKSPTIVHHPPIQMTKSPSVNGIRLASIEAKYGAKLFSNAFARYVVSFHHPEYSKRRIESEAADVVLPFQSISAFHKVKFWITDPFGRDDTPDNLDVIHVKPAYIDKRGRAVDGRFDTALVNDGTGSHFGVSGYRVARVRLVFSLPKHAIDNLFPDRKPPKHLAYVEYFSKFPAQPEANHGMYRITRPEESVAEIISVTALHRSVALFPKFGPVAPRQWTSATVLDECSKFFVSPWSDRHAYVTVL